MSDGALSAYPSAATSSPGSYAELREDSRSATTADSELDSVNAGHAELTPLNQTSNAQTQSGSVLHNKQVDKNDDHASDSTDMITNDKPDGIDNTTHQREVSTMQVLGAIVGNILEWYDFGVFGYLARPLAHNFFRGDNLTRTLLVYAMFATAFIARPFGGTIFGKLGDKIGRKWAVQLAMGTMFGCTFLMGCLPTFSEVSYAAPLLLLILRIAQGFSAGGQIVGSFLILLESAKPSERGRYSSLVQMASGLGVTLSAATVAICQSVMTHNSMDEWGWRIPFLISGVLGTISMIPQHLMEEASEFSEALEREELLENPLSTAMNTFGHEIKLIVLVLGPTCGCYYMNFIWLPNYVSEHGYSNALVVSIAFSTSMIFTTPFGGYLADTVGWSRTLRMNYGWMIMLALPSYVVLTTALHEWYGVCLVYLIMSCISGIGWGVMQLFMNDMVDNVSVRYSVMGVAYNLSVCVYGGTAPLIGEALAQGHLTLVAGYMIVLALIALYYLVYVIPPFLRDRHISRSASILKQ